MLKITGAISVLIGCVLWGTHRYFLLGRRLFFLKQAHDAVHNADTLIRCLHLPLDECFADAQGIFGDAAKLMQTGNLPADAVMAVVHKNVYIKESDKDIFRGFASGLSAADCEGQLSNIRLFCLRIENAVKDADFELRTRGKLILEGSLLFGAGVVIILI